MHQEQSTPVGTDGGRDKTVGCLPCRTNAHGRQHSTALGSPASCGPPVHTWIESAVVSCEGPPTDNADSKHSSSTTASARRSSFCVGARTRGGGVEE